MNLNQLVATAAIGCALGAAGIAVGAGTASAAPPQCPPGVQCGPGDRGPGDFNRPGGPPGGHVFPGGPERPRFRDAPWGDGPAPWGWGGPPPARFEAPLPPAWGPPPPPVNYWGYDEQPVWDPGYNQWGFYFFGIWIPLLGL
jgi:hypothetical protein